MGQIAGLWELPGFRIGLVVGILVCGLWSVIRFVYLAINDKDAALEPDQEIVKAIAVLEARGMRAYPYWISLKKSVGPGDEVLAKALAVLEPHTRYVILDEDGRVFGDSSDVHAASMKLH